MTPPTINVEKEIAIVWVVWINWITELITLGIIYII